MRYEGRLDAEADTFIGFITDGTQRMQLMIDDLLAFARAGRVEHGALPFELSHALERARENLGATIAERGAHVTSGTLPAVHGDEEPRHGHRPGDLHAHRRAPRRPHLGRRLRGRGLHLLLHAPRRRAVSS